MTSTPTITDAVELVRDFHNKNQIAAERPLALEADREVRCALLACAYTLHALAEKLQPLCPREDARGLRAHLEIEETAEMLEAMAENDEVALLDAFADKQYILCGHAAMYNLPLEAGFMEVHTSNMTKEKQPTDPNNSRLRSKGPNYVAPNLERVLREFRTPSN